MIPSTAGKTPVADKTIRIDSEVFRILQEKAEAFVDTPNTVLRRVFGLESGVPATQQPTHRGELWELIRQGLLKPGDALVWHRPRKGQTFTATVTVNGSLESGGRTFTSPSGAANALGGGSNNGWGCWQLGNVLLEKLRQQAKQAR